FESMLEDIESLGYNNYWKVLNAKDYGIPQNRERVFIVSIRKDIDTGIFSFPKGFDNGLRLKDFLENEVDEKYYISEKATQGLLRALKRPHTPKMLNKDSEYSPTLDTRVGALTHRSPYMCIPCITPDRAEKRQNGRRFKENGDPMFTLTSQDRHGILQVGNIVDTGNWGNPQRGRIYSPDGISPALNTVGGGGLEPKILKYKRTEYRIRKLTPKECWRLMGFTDEDFQKAKDEIRPILNGICINKNEFIALDGYRLALRKGNFETKEPVIVAADLIKVINKVKYECNVKIYYNDNYVKFKFDDLEIVGYRRQGNYINYNSIIPENYNTKVTLKIKPILDILKDYKKNKFKVVDLDFQNDKLIIKANNDIATVEESITIELQGEPLEISFNADYLIDAFKNYDNATLELTYCVNPMVIRENNKLDLVLPVRKK
ncbi:DNA cytosine methyltransferase, partial [Clostridium botulinum]